MGKGEYGGGPDFSLLIDARNSPLYESQSQIFTLVSIKKNDLMSYTHPLNLDPPRLH